MSLDAAVLPGLLPELLRSVFGTGAVLQEYTIGGRRHDYVVVLAQLDHPALHVVIKLAGPEAALPYPFEHTATLYRLVAERTSIQMPDIIAVDTSYHNVPWGYFIKSYIPGHEWRDVRSHLKPEELQDAYRQLGVAVAQLHTIRFPAFGEIDPASGDRQAQTLMAALRHRARKMIANPALADTFCSLLDRERRLFEDVADARLCHEDLHERNILFAVEEGRWRLATILDFDKAWAGHHEVDLARLEFWDGMMGAAFWPAYIAVHPVSSAYPQRRSIYQLLWCLEYAQPTARHLADTRQLCAELQLPTVGHF